MSASVVAILTLLVSITTLLPTLYPHLYLAYCCDALFNIIISSVITITSFKIAYSLKTDLFGFVAGVNVCIAGLIDMLFTLVVMDEKVLSLNPIQQYRAYTGFAIVCVLGFFVHKAVNMMWGCTYQDPIQTSHVSTAEGSFDEGTEPLIGFAED